MLNKYYKNASHKLQQDYQVDILEDILLGRPNRVILYCDKALQTPITFHVISGNLTTILLEDKPSIALDDLLALFDYDNAYAEVAGKEEYFKYVKESIYTCEKEHLVTFPILTKGNKVWLTISSYQIPKNPNLIAVIIENSTITMLKEEENYHKSHRDSLTGLFNKYTLDYHYGERYQMEDFHVLYFDIDNFKEVNDASGHIAGDESLRQFSSILKKYESGYNRFYRLGGDEFIGLIFKSETEVKTLASQIIEEVRNYKNPYYPKQLTVSIGIVKAVGRDDVIRKADKVLYEVKNNGKNHYRYIVEI